jgi:hypothetical protein
VSSLRKHNSALRLVVFFLWGLSIEAIGAQTMPLSVQRIVVTWSA